LIEHSDLAGFSSEDKLLVARLVRLHRRKIDRGQLQTESGLRARRLLRLTILLRLAVILERARFDSTEGRAGNRPVAKAARGRLELVFEEGVLEENIMLRSDLESERKALGKIGFELVVA
ncbi:MAG: exopolyphosphatase, partial [Planctomycetota bacterium]